MERKTIILALTSAIVVLLVILGLYFALRKPTNQPGQQQKTTDNTSGSGSGDVGGDVGGGGSGGDSGDVVTQNLPTAWQCIGDYVPVRKNTGGDIECMSQNEENCLWRTTEAECQALITAPPTNLQPLVCGTMHNTKYGTTGYDTTGHWCARARTLIG